MYGRRDTQVGAQFLEDVDEARRNCHAAIDGEAQAVRLAGAVVRVLAEYHDPCVAECRDMQGPKHFVMRRIDGCPATFVGDETLEVLPVRLFKLTAEYRVPIGDHGARK